MLGVVLGGTHDADAGRKRVVVLDFEGPKAGRFHDDLVRMVKKTSNELVSTDKWNGTAEEMDASDASEANIKKVAKKLKVDAVIEGKIEKRRDEFIIRLKLRSANGDLIGSPVDTKAESAKIDGRAQREIKDELLDALDSAPGGSAGPAKKSDDDDDDKPVLATRGSKTKKKHADDDDDDKPAVKKASKKSDDDDDDDKPTHKGFAKHMDDERGGDKTDDDKPAKKVAKKSDDDDDDKPAKKPVAKKSDDDDKPAAKKPAAKKVADDDDDKPAAKKPAAKKVADDDDDKPAAKKPVVATKKPAAKKSDDDDDDKPAKKRVAVADDDAEVSASALPREPLDQSTALSPGERALEATIGFEATSRSLKFTSAPNLTSIPDNYGGNPNPGMEIDVTGFPLAYNHTIDNPLKNIGLNLNGYRAFHVESQNNRGGTITKFHSFDSRFGFGGEYRFAFFEHNAMSPVLIGSLNYADQQFTIEAGAAHNHSSIPNVRYKMVEPAIGVRVPVTSKITANLDAKIMAMLDTGQIQGQTQYGTSVIHGYEGQVSVDYLIMPKIFVRAAFHAETIGFTFQGNGQQSNFRDNDPTTKDVSAARDTYLGGMVLAGYLY